MVSTAMRRQRCCAAAVGTVLIESIAIVASATRNINAVVLLMLAFLLRRENAVRQLGLPIIPIDGPGRLILLADEIEGVL